MRVNEVSEPVEQNTIDFLVTTKKDTNGLDDIKYISANGMDTSNDNPMVVQSR